MFDSPGGLVGPLDDLEASFSRSSGSGGCEGCKEGREGGGNASSGGRHPEKGMGVVGLVRGSEGELKRSSG
jgi:hypothetical protein